MAGLSLWLVFTQCNGALDRKGVYLHSGVAVMVELM